jgi:hypothetical protein
MSGPVDHVDADLRDAVRDIAEFAIGSTIKDPAERRAVAGVIVDQVLASLALAQAPGHGVFAHAAQLRAIEQ